MYERFTDRARKAFQLANQEAQRLNHKYINTEHILLGLVKEGSGVAAHALGNLDIDLRRIRSEVEKMIVPGPEAVAIGKLPQTPQARTVIEQSIAEARTLHHDYVGTEHLLLGLLHEQEGVAAQVLVSLGLKLEDVREEVRALSGQRLETEAAESGKAQAANLLKEYDIYLPLRYSDGSAVETEKIENLKNQLRGKFGGLSCFPQTVVGTWKLGHVTLKEDVLILGVLTLERYGSREFFVRFKDQLKAMLRQEDILILEREVRAL